MDRAVSCYFAVLYLYWHYLLRNLFITLLHINRLIFQKGMLMLSSRQETMLRKLSCLWMVYVFFQICNALCCLVLNILAEKIYACLFSCLFNAGSD